MTLLEPKYFADYELIDSGNFSKLERFGAYILSRPEPQAIWNKSLSDGEWQRLAHAIFLKAKEGSKEDADSNERGEWQLKKGMPEQWFVNYKHNGIDIKMRLGLTAFKHVGIFPEQASNWDYIFETIKAINEPEVNVLNLFAYTGGASLAAKAAGADVSHVDSVKQVITWSRANMEASGMDNIRWIVEDALKFVQREARRGKKYNGIILDPPKYGRGPEGERWLLEKNINELMLNCKQLLKPNNCFVVLNLYSMGFSAIIANNLLNELHSWNQSEYGELKVTDKAQKSLPLSIFARGRSL